MELSSILALSLGLMTGAQFLTLMSEALKDRRQTEAQAATVNDFSDGQRYSHIPSESPWPCTATTKKEKEVTDAGCEDWNPPTLGGEAVENHRWDSDCAGGAVCHRQRHELSVAFSLLISSQPYVSEHIQLPSQKFSLILPYRTPRCVVPQRRINTGKSACRLRGKNWEVRYIRKAFTWRFISWLFET